jgi:hypothetical protein
LGRNFWIYSIEIKLFAFCEVSADLNPLSREFLEKPTVHLVEENIPSFYGTGEFLTYLLTHSMEQSPSLEANWFCS